MGFEWWWWRWLLFSGGVIWCLLDTMGGGLGLWDWMDLKLHDVWLRDYRKRKSSLRSCANRLFAIAIFGSYVSNF